MTGAWKEALVRGSGALGVEPSTQQVERLATFADLLARWGSKFDLSAIEDPAEVREKHFLDSLSALPLLTEGGMLVDLGSGAGFPGLVLAAMREDLAVVSVESRSKKAVFQRQVARDLKLTNVEVRAERIEKVELARPPRWVTARALTDLRELVELSAAWLGGGAELVAWKSSKVDEEIAAATAAMAKAGVTVKERRDFRLPESGDPRTLLRIGR